jgi:hypothetical protein
VSGGLEQGLEEPTSALALLDKGSAVMLAVVDALPQRTTWSQYTLQQTEEQCGGKSWSSNQQRPHAA